MKIAGKLNVIALVFTVVSLLGVATTSATTVLDQEFFPTDRSDFGSVISPQDLSWGVTQTFTVEQAGVLDSVEIHAGIAFPLTELRILQTIGGVPLGGAGTSVVLASTTLVTSLPGDIQRFDLSGAGLIVNVGDILAIEPINDPIGLASWRGHSNVDYPGGQVFTFNTSNSNWTLYPGTDMRFRTYVTVPEPASAALLAIGGLAALRRSKRVYC